MTCYCNVKLAPPGEFLTVLHRVNFDACAIRTVLRMRIDHARAL